MYVNKCIYIYGYIHVYLKWKRNEDLIFSARNRNKILRDANDFQSINPCPIYKFCGEKKV